LGLGSTVSGLGFAVSGLGFALLVPKPQKPQPRNCEAQPRNCGAQPQNLEAQRSTDPNSLPREPGRHLKHVRYAHFSDLYVFYEGFGEVADQGSSREGGRGEGNPSPQEWF